jgi:hypothetical protein
MKKTTRMLLLGLALTGATAAMGSVSYADKCVPDPNAICPFIYAPVTCNDGVTYTNQCFADAACAKGCHPAGGV